MRIQTLNSDYEILRMAESGCEFPYKSRVMAT